MKTTKEIIEQLQEELKDREDKYQRCAKNIKSNIEKDKTLSGTKIRESHIAYNDATSKIELLQELHEVFNNFKGK